MSNDYLDDDEIITFGKHEGEAIEDLPRSYLKWLLENFDEDKYPMLYQAAENAYY